LPLYKPGRYAGRKSAATSAVVATARYFPNYKFLRLPRIMLALRFRVPISPFPLTFLPFLLVFPRAISSDWICPILCIEREKGEAGNAQVFQGRYIPLYVLRALIAALQHQYGIISRL